MILDAERIAERMTPPVADPREYLLAFYPKAPIPPLDHVVRTARPMVARINHGIWSAPCECGSRTDLDRGRVAPGCVVWLSIPLGFCVRCGNQGTGRGWRPVAVPTADMRAAIEGLLSCRPNESDRNWESSESIGDLAEQNREHGDPITKRVALRAWAAGLRGAA